MKSLVVALMMCLVTPAFAQDMGTKPTANQECAGFTVTPKEAQTFSQVYDLLIFAASQIVTMDTIATTEQQQEIVDKVLKPFDDAALGTGTACIDAPASSLKLTLIIGDKMTGIIDRAGAGPKVAAVLEKLAGSPQKAEAAIKVFQSLVRKMMVVVNTGSSI